MTISAMDEQPPRAINAADAANTLVIEARDAGEYPPTKAADMRYAALLGWCWPRRAALRTWDGSLGLAWKWHFGISLVFLVVLAVLIPWAAHGRPTEFIDDLTAAFARDFSVSLLFVGMAVVLFEGGFLALAMVVMPWGCEDEPVGRSFANALRQTWLHTFHGVPAILIVFLLVRWQAHARETLRWEHGSLYFNQQAILLRYSDPLISLVICVLGAWILWSLIRAVTAPRPVVDEVMRDPTCEGCGYNLRLMPMDRRCPECGLPVVESLGEDARPGPPLMHRSVGWWRGYRRTVLLAEFRPQRLGRMLPTRRPMRGHGVVYAVHLLVWFVAVATTGILFEYWETVQRVGRIRLHWSTLSSMAARNIDVAGYWLAGLIGVIGLWAFLVTLVAWWRARRNLGHVAMAMTSYASATLVVWTLVLCSMFFGILWTDTGQKILAYFDNPYVDPGWVLLWIGVLVAAMVLLGYAVAVWRGTMAARWANV